MSELSIRVRKQQDNGSSFRATPDNLYLGGVRSAKVDKLKFELPEEWAACAVTLHVQRLSGTLPDPQALDAENCVEVDRRWTLEKQGMWMLLAVGEGGYIAMTKPAQYTCYETIDTDSTTETIDPSVYEQFVDLVRKSVNEAKDSAKKTAEDRAAADQILTDTKQAGTDAVAAIGNARRTALDDVETARTGALTDIGNARAGALEDIGTARQGAVQEVADTKSAALQALGSSRESALTALEEKRASALQEMQASVDAAAGSAEKAAASESNAKESEDAAKASEEAAAKSEAAAQASKEAAATSEANALKYSQEAGAKAGTDPTLTVSGAPADAKAVGDALGNIDLSWDAIDGKPEAFPPASHTHDDRYYQKTEIDQKVDYLAAMNQNATKLVFSQTATTGTTSSCSGSFSVPSTVDYIEFDHGNGTATVVRGGTGVGKEQYVQKDDEYNNWIYGTFTITFSQSGTVSWTKAQSSNVVTHKTYTRNVRGYHYITMADFAAAQAALQSAQTDTDSLMVDQEYRLTLLELGIEE